MIIFNLEESHMTEPSGVQVSNSHFGIRILASRSIKFIKVGEILTPLIPFMVLFNA